MRIRWTPAAAADLQSISDYLKEHHPRYPPTGHCKLYEPAVVDIGPRVVAIWRPRRTPPEILFSLLAGPHPAVRGGVCG